jgi:hypothetical protein
MFSFQRFARLAKAHWAEYRKTYAWFIGIGIMVHFVLLALMFAGSGLRAITNDAQEVIYYAGLFTTAPIFAARYFQAMARKEAALIVLMRPASTFEKWLLAFLFVTIFYPVAYTLAFYVCDLPPALLAQALGDTMSTAASEYRVYFILNDASLGQLISVALTLTIFQAFGVLGSLYFRAMPFIKTILTAFLVLLFSIFLTIVFSARPDNIYSYWTMARELSPAQQILYPLMWIALPLLLWLASYFALKEREAA